METGEECDVGKLNLIGRHGRPRTRVRQKILGLMEKINAQNGGKLQYMSPSVVHDTTAHKETINCRTQISYNKR